MEERKENPKMLEHLCGIDNRVQLRAQWHRLHHRQKQASKQTVGTVDAIECTALDLCATALTQQEIVMWILELEELCGQ